MPDQSTAQGTCPWVGAVGLDGDTARGSQKGFHVLSKGNKPDFYVRLVPKLFYKCDRGQADPVVAVARDQSSVYLALLMHEPQPPSHLSVSAATRYAERGAWALARSFHF